MGLKGKKLHFSSLIIRLPLYIAIFSIIQSVMNGSIGYHVFKNLFEQQYNDITQQIAYTALSYIDPDMVLTYAQGAPADDAWVESNTKLNQLTDTAKLAYIYVTVPDQSFESRIYVYDTIHPEILKHNQKAKVYPLGTVNTLKTYDKDYIDNLKAVMHQGKPYIRFVYNKTGGHVTTSVPVVDTHGAIVAILSIVKPMSESRALKTQYVNTTFITSLVFTILFISVYVFLLSTQIVRPIVWLTDETQTFAKHKGSLTGILSKIKGNSELAHLARAVEQMSIDMKQYITELTRTTAEKERLTAELDVARQIQANMLPQLFPPYADHPEIELFASMSPAKEVGGDFYDFFMVDDDHFAVVVGDVSGKGVPAALFMVIAKTLIKNITLRDKDAAKVFEQVNNQLCEGNEAGLFVTCWMGILTLSTGIMQFANAGHTAPIVYHNGEVQYLTTKPNLMLAGLPGTKYQNHTTTLQRGDRIFIYTDGITEATNANNELYGEERLVTAVKNTEGVSSKEILHKVREDVDRFVGSAPQFDDITMLELSLKA